MRRRDFITLLGGATAWPLAARAQQAGEHMRRVGVLMAYAESDPEAQARIGAVRQGLRERGWKRAITSKWRFAGGQATLIVREPLQPNSSPSHQT
jgi:putative tryptophan/tyrosine transport system substrate-binding protein